MSKELEALKEIRKCFGEKIMKSLWKDKATNYTYTITVNEYCDIIETTLKESEKALTFYKYCVKNKIDLAKLDQISDDYIAMPIEVWEEKLKKLAVLELLKKNLVIAFEEDNGIDLPALVVGIKTDKNKLCVIYSTQNKEEISILKEVLL